MHYQAASRPMLEVRREARRERLGLSLVYAVRLVEHPVTQIHELVPEGGAEGRKERRGGVMAQVLRIVQSPMNPARWCLELDCGHETWITATTCPTRKTHRCPQSHCNGRES